MKSCETACIRQIALQDLRDKQERGSKKGNICHVIKSNPSGTLIIIGCVFLNTRFVCS